jgi:phospholipid/cholesterol/gamma-HCH transport system substrate-binding protein
MRINAGPLLKVTAFVVIMGFLIACIGVVFGRVRIEASGDYQAIFNDASGLTSGSDVRGNGVAIGTVKAVELHDGKAKVTFTVADDVELTEATSARVRYANLTGDRYLDLEPGKSQDAARLSAGATIPLARTQPALDLDTFFQGFDPLMRGLDPQEVNDLAANIIAVSQGQAGSVEQMLGNVASFTNRLADRDEIIGDTITNLSAALQVMDDHRGQFDQLIVGLASLTKGFAEDRRIIGSSLASINTAAVQTADLLRRIRPGVKANLDQIGVLAGHMNDNVVEIREVLDVYPELAGKLGRLGAYGSFFNFYLCGVKVKVDLPGDDLDVYTPWVVDNTGRCGGKER